MSLLSNLLGQVTPGTSVPQNAGSYGLNGLSTLLSGNTKDLLALLKEYYQENPKVIAKGGKLGFDVSNLAPSQVSELKTAFQNALDDLFGGALQLSLDGGVLGIDTTGLSSADTTTLQALLESLDKSGSSLTNDQKAEVAQSITGILNSPSLFIIQSAGTDKVAGLAGSKPSAQVPIPPPSTPQPPPSQFAYLAGLIAIQAGETVINSVQSTDTALGQIQKDQAEQLMKDIIQAVQDQQKNAEKAKISKIFGWIVSVALIIIGIVCTVVGVVASVLGGAGVPLAALGIGLIVGGVIGCIMSSDVGDKITTDLTNALVADGLSKTDAAIVATLIIVVSTIIVCAAAGAIAGPVVGAAVGAVTTAEVATESAIVEGTTTAVEVAGETAAEGSAAAGEATGSIVEAATSALRNSTQLFKVIRAAITLFSITTALGNVGLSISQGIAEDQLGDAEKAYLSEVALSKEIAATLNILLKSLQGSLEALNTGISNAAGVIGQVPTIGSFAAGGRSV